MAHMDRRDLGRMLFDKEYACALRSSADAFVLLDHKVERSSASKLAWDVIWSMYGMLHKNGRWSQRVCMEATGF